jgi:hypothetical protein
MNLIETNFMDRFDYYVGVAVLAVLIAAAWVVLQFICR